MRVLVDLSPRQMTRIQELLDSGRYGTLNSFIQLAVENQLLLESDESADKVVSADVAPSNGLEKARAVPGEGVEPKESQELRVGATQRAPSFPLDEHLFQKPDVLPLLAEREHMLPGFISRILPVKYAARLLHRDVLAASTEMIPLPKFLEQVGEEALRMGEWLAQKDREAGRHREQSYAAGFPRATRDASRSMERYRNLFVASVRQSDGRVDGAMALLRFIVLRRLDGGVYIGLTEPGEKFARLSNPVLDGELESPLSPEERSFYMTHIRNWVPAEFGATRIILEAVRNGITDRDELNHRLARAWPTNWSDDQVNSWRSSLMSRLSELGVLERIRVGRTLTYTYSGTLKDEVIGF